MDFQSKTWLELKAKLEDQRAHLVNALIHPNCEHDRAQFFRGKIAKIDEILALESPAPKPVAVQTVSYD